MAYKFPLPLPLPLPLVSAFAILGGTVVLAGSASCGSSPRSGFQEEGEGGAGSSNGGFSSSGTSSGSANGGNTSGGFNLDGSGGGTSSGAMAIDGSVPCPPGLQCNYACSGGATTTISGTVYDPAMRNPLYDVAVYVPATALQPLPKGVPTGNDACSCGALFKSGALTSTTTDVQGHFSLPNVPVGNGVQLVLQVGKWRHVVTVPTVNACQDNAMPDKSLALNATIAPGSSDSLPDIAVSTGHSDTLECLMKRIGLPDSEFVAGTASSGHVHIYLGGDPNSPWTGSQTGGQPTRELARMPGAPESDTTLWDSQAHLMPYDILLLSCEGGPTFNANPPVLEAYLNAGGRAFASHYHYDWFFQPPMTPPATTPPPPADWANLATWTIGSGGGTDPGDGVVDQTLNVSGAPFPKGQALDKWLANVGALVPLPGVTTQPAGVATGDVPIYQTKFNAVVGPANTASQPWITTKNGGTTEAMYFSFDTPVNAKPPAGGGAPNYCGRAVFSDLHVNGDKTAASWMDSDNPQVAVAPRVPPPQGCADGALSPQEAVLEFMLFDLSSCVVSDTVPPSKTIPVY